MADGLSAFNEALVEYWLIDRSKKNNETIDQAIKREISDMTRMLFEIHTIKDTAKRMMTEWTIKHVIWFYLLMRKNNLKHGSLDDYKIIVKNIEEYFLYMDDMYYSQLEWFPDDMEELVHLLDKKTI